MFCRKNLRRLEFEEVFVVGTQRYLKEHLCIPDFNGFRGAGDVVYVSSKTDAA